MAGMSHSADRFFYVNPLASDGGHHRQPWYGTACCPSNISRFLPSIGGYIYATGSNSLWVNMYIGSQTTATIDGKNTEVSIQTQYPWEGASTITLNPEKPQQFSLRMRIPGWCKSWTLSLNGKAQESTTENGYAVITRKWKKGDKVTLNLDMPVEVMVADTRVKANEGRRAIQRGPIVYCIEEVDNPSIAEALLAPNATYTPTFDSTLLGGCTTISTTDANGNTLKFIPYFLWDNRAAGKMDVWVKTY